jgi:hypothetical protein
VRGVQFGTTEIVNIPVHYVDVVTMTLGIELLAIETNSPELLDLCTAKGRGKGTGAFVPEGLIENALHKRALCPELRQRLDQLEEMEKRLASKTARLVLIDGRGFCDPAAKGQGKIQHRVIWEATLTILLPCRSSGIIGLH